MSLVANLAKYQIPLNKQRLAVQTIWLFHISGIIGISLGFFDFFVPKTPLNLLVAFGLLIWVFPLNSTKKLTLTALFFTVGMFVEWLGVNYGVLFGTYAYGENLGLKIDGVPLLIGVNWAMLVLITGAIANECKVAKPLKVLIGASLMVLLDFLLELSAPIFDFWEFEGNMVPLENYVTWFIIAAILHTVFQVAKLQGNSRFCFHLYGCQFLFFSYFYIYNSL